MVCPYYLNQHVLQKGPSQYALQVCDLCGCTGGITHLQYRGRHCCPFKDSLAPPPITSLPLSLSHDISYPHRRRASHSYPQLSQLPGYVFRGIGSNIAQEPWIWAAESFCYYAANVKKIWCLLMTDTCQLWGKKILEGRRGCYWRQGRLLCEKRILPWGKVILEWGER